MGEGCFNCSGKVNINDWQLNISSLLVHGEVDNVLNEQKSWPNLNSNIFGCETLGINILINIKHFTRCIEAQLKQFERYEKLTSFGKQLPNNQKNFFLTRLKVCEFILHLRNYLLSMNEQNFALHDIDEAEKNFDELLRTLHKFISRLNKISDSTFLYAISNIGNKSLQPEYHMYHIHLDLRWLIISLIFIKNNLQKHINNNIDDLENIIYTVINDLIYISLKIFRTIPNSQLISKTPYSCTCMRELWIMLQIFIDELSVVSKVNIFWFYINFILKQLFSTDKIATSQKNINLPDSKNPEIFCIWLIYHLTLLYGYNKNGEYTNGPSARFREIQMETGIDIVEKILKVYVNKGGKDGARDEIDEELCTIIPLLHVLNYEWWKPQVQIITLLWDCFHRRLDQPFLMQSRGPWSVSSEKKTPMDILDQIRDRIKNSNEINNKSSFDLFLRLLGSVLQRHYSCKDFKIWNQIKGRIYSRFSQNKIQEFSEFGLYNFISLFLTLAVTADTVNVYSAMVNLLPSVLEWSDSTGGKKCCLIWKSKLIILLLYNEQKISFKDIVDDFTETANAISCRKDEFSRSMMTWFIDVLKIIVTYSDDFGHFEHGFFGGWIDRYLLECSSNKVNVLTNILLKIFEKCSYHQNINTTENSLMLNALWNNAASRIRQMVTIYDPCTNFYENPTKLAVAFTLEACRDPTIAKKYRHSAISLFQHFSTSLIIKDIRITRLYLTLILQNDTVFENLKKEVSNFNIICIQAWIKCNVLNCDNNSETEFLKNYITNLPEIKELLNLENRKLNEFLSNNEAIINFLIIVSKKRKSLKSEQQCMTFDSKCKPFFHNIEKWACQLINEENKDTKLSRWIYRCIGTIILYCSPILYTKNQSNNVLKMLINKVALPPEQPIQQCLMYLTQKIFSMIVLGIENLNIKSDLSLQTLVRELFERYLPLLVLEGNNENSFKVSENLLECFLKANSNYARLILDILARSFIIIPSGNNTHKLCNLVILMLRFIIQAGEVYPTHIVQSIVLICTPSILVCYMKVNEHHFHKQQTIDFLRDLFSNAYLKKTSEIRENLYEIIWNVLNKFIVLNLKVSFTFLSSILKVDFNLFKYLYSLIEQNVSEYERKNSSIKVALRNSLDSIKKNSGFL